MITDVYAHITRSHRIFNRWCLLYYTREPYAPRKPKNQINMQQAGHSDSDKEESMSTSETGAKGDLDEESSATFETVAENDVGFSSKRNRQEETCEPCHKKKERRKKGMGSEMGLMVIH